jgi:catechol 2,3-dioxygenase-like lactoylglutathione lyase family enzyme
LSEEEHIPVSDDFPATLHYHHTGIFVSDMETSIEWYENVLGYKFAWRKEHDLPGQGLVDMCWLKHQDHYIELYGYKTDQRPFDMKDYLGSLGTKHLCLWVKNEEFEPLAAYFESKGVEFMVRGRHPESVVGKPGGEGVMYIKDPDGIPIEIQEEIWPEQYPHLSMKR